MMARNVDSVRAVDRYAVEVRLKERSGVLIPSLAFEANAAGIFPREVVEAAGDKATTQYIGTGPYKVIERQPDRFIKMARFDKYAARPEPASGWGGKKVAYVDTLVWTPIPDAAARIAVLESGEADATFDASVDAYGRLKANPGIRTEISKPYYWLATVFNQKKGIFSDDTPAGQKLRQAVLAAVDQEPIALAAVGRPEFYRLDGSISFREEGRWWIDVPSASFDPRDKARARRLIQEAGYKGQPIRYLTTQEYDWMYKFAVVVKQQLEEVGLRVDLQVVDWATLVQRRNNPQMYDIFTTGMSFVPDPTQHPYLRCDWPGWTCDEQIQQGLDAIRRETDQAKRRAIWEQIHKRFYEYVPAIRYGDIFGLRAMQAYVKGFNESMTFPRFYNVWLDK